MKFIRVLKATTIYNDDLLKLKKAYNEILPKIKNIDKLAKNLENQAYNNIELINKHTNQKSEYDPNAKAQYDFANKITYYIDELADTIKSNINNINELLQESEKSNKQFDNIIDAKNNPDDIPDAVLNYMEFSHLDPLSADTYEDAINYCKTLIKNPKDYIDDNYENLLQENIINENFDKNLVIKIIDKTLRQYGKDYLSEVKLNKDKFRK